MAHTRHAAGTVTAPVIDKSHMPRSSHTYMTAVLHRCRRGCTWNKKERKAARTRAKEHDGHGRCEPGSRSPFVHRRRSDATRVPAAAARGKHHTAATTECGVIPWVRRYLNEAAWRTHTTQSRPANDQTLCPREALAAAASGGVANDSRPMR